MTLSPCSERYIHLEPNHPGARKLLANILLKRELPSVAIDVLKPTVGKRRADPEALALLSQAHMRLGQAREANELLELAGGDCAESSRHPDSARHEQTSDRSPG